MIPTVHNNGTAGEVLLDQNTTVLEAVRKAIDALYDAAPNARDYYQTPGAFVIAQRVHASRIAALTNVRDQIAATVEGIQDQIDAKEASRRSR